MRRVVFLALVVAALIVAGPPAAAQAAPLTLGDLHLVSGMSPWEPFCGEEPGTGTLYMNSEVEVHVEVNPTDPDNVVAFWQQDRWSDGGAQGDMAAYSTDGGETWTLSAPEFSNCAGGEGTAGGFERATDPWLSFGPDGRLHAIAIGFDNTTPRNAILTSYSDDGGATWSEVEVVRFDNPRALGNNFNDKETLTADPTDPDLVYATWQRIVSPSERASARAYERAFSWYSEAYFARSTDGGETWEPAESIWKPRGRHEQAIGNQVEVLPDGTLINGFNLIRAISNRQGTRGYNIAVMTSDDKGETWTEPMIIERLLSDEVTDPDTGADVRTGDILPDWAVDHSDTETSGNIYVVWMDTRFNDPDHNDILLARSSDGGVSFDSPVIVDSTPAGVDAFTPMVDVDETGRVAVTYYDFRFDQPGDAALSTDFWITHSHDGGDTFEASQRMSPDSFDMRSAPFANGYFVGDYTGLDHVGSTFHAAWVEANDGNTVNPTDVLHRTAE